MCWLHFRCALNQNYWNSFRFYSTLVLSDCFERIALEAMLPFEKTFLTIDINSLRICKEKCIQEGDKCQTISFGHVWHNPQLIPQKKQHRLAWSPRAHLTFSRLYLAETVFECPRLSAYVDFIHTRSLRTVSTPKCGGMGLMEGLVLRNLVDQILKSVYQIFRKA